MWGVWCINRVYNNVYTICSALQINVTNIVSNRLRIIVHSLYILCMASKDTQLNIRVESELLERLKKLAEVEVTTPSQLVRKAVTLYIRQSEGDRLDG
jgi:hypothetical protein